jgi:hypothetical protein
MSKAPAMNRRQFMLLALAVTGSLAARSKLPGVASGWLKPENLLRSKLTTLFIHLESAQTIGLAYLQSYPNEADAQRLEDQIAMGIAGGRAVLAAASTREISALINNRIRQDFEAEQVVKVQGWVLSITEARLCALSALA